MPIFPPKSLITKYHLLARFQDMSVTKLSVSWEMSNSYSFWEHLLGVLILSFLHAANLNLTKYSTQELINK